MFVYELNGCGFESRCSHLNFRFRACFKQGVPWHSGNYRVWIHSEMRTWHDKNIQSWSPVCKVNEWCLVDCFHCKCRVSTQIMVFNDCITKYKMFSTCTRLLVALWVIFLLFKIFLLIQTLEWLHLQILSPPIQTGHFLFLLISPASFSNKVLLCFLQCFCGRNRQPQLMGLVYLCFYGN